MPRGGFGRGFGRGFGGRRFGTPLIVPMGGYGWGMGSPLLTTLMAGGLGYALGSNSAEQNAPQYPAYSSPQQFPPSQAQQAPTPDAEASRLAKMQLLGELHRAGMLTDEEFEREKQRILSE